jgi:hypothetical protein
VAQESFATSAGAITWRNGMLRFCLGFILRQRSSRARHLISDDNLP